MPRTDDAPTPARRLRDALEPIAMVHVHSREAAEQYEAIGIAHWSGYVVGRAGTLGLPPTSLVVATFGAFAPEVLEPAYESGLASAAVPDVLAAKEAAATRCLHRVLGEPGRDAAEAVTALRAGAESVEVLGKPLFAGLRAMDWPADGWGRLWHAANLWRELRGDAHIAALVAGGIGTLASNLLTEAHVGIDHREYTRTRSWSEGQIDAAVADLVDRGILTPDGATLTERGRALRDDIEAATEATLDPAVEAVGGALDVVVGRCADWSAAIVAGEAFPDDRFKLAAG